MAFFLPFHAHLSGVIHRYIKNEVLIPCLFKRLFTTEKHHLYDSDLKRILLIFASILLVFQGLAQNLVPNGSFEEKPYCPSSYNMQTLKTVKFWKQPNSATPDHFHTCASGKAGVPDNIVGSQAPLDGEAYIGLVTYTSTKKNYREYLQAKLNRKLSAGETICVEFWVSCADKAIYVTDGLGVQFSKTALHTRNQGLIDGRPQVANPKLHILDNADSWIKLSDTFIATGGEEYITIGNFLPDPLISKLLRTDVEGMADASDWAYVYVDDLVVKSVQSRSECSCLNDQIRAEVHDPPLQLSESREVQLQTVYFAFDDSTLDQVAQTNLEMVAALLRSNKYMFVQVNGHADVIGREGYNVELSANRAHAVVAHLKFLGVDPSRLQIDFYGSTLPAADNSSSSGRAENRRVEFQVLERKYVQVD